MDRSKLVDRAFAYQWGPTREELQSLADTREMQAILDLLEAQLKSHEQGRRTSGAQTTPLKDKLRQKGHSAMSISALCTAALGG